MVAIGTDYHLISGEDRAAIFDVSSVQSRTDIGRGKQSLLGVFAQASIIPLERLEVLASARVERIRNFDGFDGNPGGQGAVPDRTDNAFSPRISARYEVTDRWALRAAAYKAFRTPNLDSLYRGFAAGGFVQIPNSKLKPEHLRGAEAGFDFTTSMVRAQVTAFYNQIRDLITFRNLDPAEVPAGFAAGGQNINAGRSRSRGVEAEVDWSLDRRWSVQAGYARILAEITENAADPSSVGQQLNGLPKNRASASAQYKGDFFKASARVRYAPGHFGATGLSEDAYTVVDLSTSWTVHRTIEIYANIENLFDRRYVADNTGFTPPQLGTPRSVFVGLRARFP
jgi:outer membrane receptor protein involved in Fe transport